MNRQQAIEQALMKCNSLDMGDCVEIPLAQWEAVEEALALPEDAEEALPIPMQCSGTEDYCAGYSDGFEQALRATPQADAEAVIEQVMAEYEREMCPWDNVDYLHRCADRYANVKEPSHLHCLAFALSRKLKSQPQADPERVALLERIDAIPLAYRSTLLRDIRAYLKGGE